MIFCHILSSVCHRYLAYDVFDLDNPLSVYWAHCLMRNLNTIILFLKTEQKRNKTANQEAGESSVRWQLKVRDVCRKDSNTRHFLLVQFAWSMSSNEIHIHIFRAWILVQIQDFRLLYHHKSLSFSCLSMSCQFKYSCVWHIKLPRKQLTSTKLSSFSWFIALKRPNTHKKYAKMPILVSIFKHSRLCLYWM